ncbi:Poly [ADP-ribose] polymerase 12 [Bagarius yarrelli]|uniref:Poly [ADP-ribose] polymerase 12 n=1 Tax=Bagarius yarrelli TaxID=175774 RepID=A0A556THJ7_BAGYA|nr:Poly [ADP-ribose] polymerase 12 [Bagarius yarrelli]
MSSYSRVIHHATSILCSHKGSMELSQLYRKVYQRFDISDEVFWFILKKCSRFALVRNRSSAETGEVGYMVVAKTSLRLCKSYAKLECFGCQDLHLCKYFVYGNCRYGKGRKECKFSHNIQSEHNFPLLRECTLHELHEEDLFLLLLQNDPALLPEVCSHYNKGSGQFGSCTFKENCTKVHMCQHFVQDNCIFGTKCKRLHCVDQYGCRMLEERGLSSDIIQELSFLYQNVHRLNNSAADADQCKLVHFNLPYKWEVDEGNGWRDLQGMEEIERAFSDPRNAHGPGSMPVDFQTMTRSGHPVRRLSTVSSITKPSHYVLTTNWLWYYKGDHNNWIEYGRPRNSHPVYPNGTTVSSRRTQAYNKLHYSYRNTQKTRDTKLIHHQMPSIHSKQASPQQMTAPSG